jgi:hypothetical protein
MQKTAELRDTYPNGSTGYHSVGGNYGMKTRFSL